MTQERGVKEIEPFTHYMFRTNWPSSGVQVLWTRILLFTVVSNKGTINDVASRRRRNP
jgi:hypothetical protein